MKDSNPQDLLDELQALSRGEARRPSSLDLEADALFAGISGLELTAEAELLPGVILRPAYVDVFAAPMAAFAPPEKPREPHPGPWIAVEGGFSFKVRAELAIAATAELDAMPRRQFLWLVAALLRLKVPRPIQAVFVANKPLQDLPSDWRSSKALAFEAHANHIGAWRNDTKPLNAGDLTELCSTLLRTLVLVKEYRFQTALTVFDQVNWSGGLGAGIQLLWTAVETIFGLGRGLNKGDQLAAAVSGYLTLTRSDRDRLYSIVRDAYRKRGHIIHAGRMVPDQDFISAVLIARGVLERVLTEGSLPLTP